MVSIWERKKRALRDYLDPAASAYSYPMPSDPLRKRFKALRERH